MMSDAAAPKQSLKNLTSFRRAASRVSPQSLVRETGDRLPLVCEPSVKGVDLVAWAAEHRALVGERLLAHGGLLFRDFRLGEVSEFERLMKTLAGELLEYTYGSTPRTQVSGRVYTSTEYPASQSIPLHNEMSYARQWPARIWFLCRRPAHTGGATPIADSRRVLGRLDPALVAEFTARGVMYVRNYGAGLDLTWRQAFRTESRAEVEEFCRRASIEYEWRGGDRLRTRQVCQAVTRHTQTGEEVWFNQAHLFHVSSLEPAAREALLAQLGEEELPRHAYYGDGAPIPAAALAEIRAAYEAEAVTFDWREGDVLMLDNVLVAHGRAPYAGERSILVGMA